ncbi:MAG: nuclear transport factor 2 family protein [Deltaproteobacteria bacterium]|nr:nuclear transport factor 2 family protein [Deltaproteobacteria bacterium]
MLVLVASCRRTDAAHDLGQKWVDALNSRDPARVAALMASDGTFLDPVTPQPLSVDGFRSRLQIERTVWKEREYRVRQLVANDDRIAIKWELKQRYANDVLFPIEGLTVLDVRDGRVASVRDYYNAALYLGLLSAQPAK